MRFYLLFLLLGILIVACGNEVPQGASTSGKAGEEIYKKYCMICHGENGDMKVNGARDLNDSKLNLELRVMIITNGRGLMTPFKDILSAKEIEQVAKYTMRRFKKQ